MPLTRRGGSVRGPARRGFTLVEITIAAVIFLVLSGIIFQMFIKGTRTGVKATWRTHVAGKSRSALRQIKEAIDGSSYPSVVSLTNYQENADPLYAFTLGPSPSASVAGGSLTTHVYDAAGATVASWYRCHPLDQTPMAAPLGIPSGYAALHALELRDSESYPGKRLDLWMTITTGTINPVIPPDVTLAGAPQIERLLTTEVEKVDLTVATTGTAGGNYMLTVRVTSRDPSDGYMRVVEESRANVNVAVVGP